MSIFHEETCPVCGKVFEPYTPYWQYKIVDGHYQRRLKVCSYTCQMKFEKKQNEKKEKLKNG